MERAGLQNLAEEGSNPSSRANASLKTIGSLEERKVPSRVHYENVFKGKYMKRTIEVINTDRKRNAAYIAWVQDDPYWATNTEVKLDWIEKLMGCTFDEGDHGFVTIHYDGDLEYL